MYLYIWLINYYNLIYEGDSISKLQIVIEKNRMEIMTYKQHLFFSIISMQIQTLFPPFHKSPVFDALQRFRCGDLHRPTGSMFVFDNCPPFRELLHPIMDCLTWQAVFTVHGQHILCFIFLPTKNAQRHAALSWYMYSGAPPSCNICYVCTVMRISIVVRHNKTR